LPEGRPGMVIDPLAIRTLSRRHGDAVDILMRLIFPMIPAWQGIGATIYRDRMDALSHRRDELADAHREAGATLHDFAFAAQGLLDDMSWRGRQRDTAQERVAALTVALHRTTDPAEIHRLEAERAAVEAERRRAQDLWRSAKSELARREKACAHTIQGLASLHALPSVASRIWRLPLADFTAYRMLVEAGRLPREGLNWTNDGCSDHHLVTWTSSDDACIRHDFGYRNADGLAATPAKAKAMVDTQFGQDLRDVCAATTNHSLTDVALGDRHSIVDCEVMAVEALVGVSLLGRPSSNERGQKSDR
jgi:hypothetical protein